MRKRYALLAVALLASGAIAWAESGALGTPGQPDIVTLGYKIDKQTAPFRSSLAVVDTQTDAGIKATTQFALLGKPYFKVGPRFSASGQTCKVIVFYAYFAAADGSGTGYIFDHSAETTFTGGSTAYAGAQYWGASTAFDGKGATHVYAVVTTAPSSGTVDLWCGSN